MIEISKKFTTEKFEATYEVEEEEDGLRLDQFLMGIFQSFSRQQIKKKIKNGDIKIHDRPYPHKPSVKVYYKERVSTHTLRGTLEDEYWRGEKLELELIPPILFEDDNIVAISKPPYMTTHPTGKHLFNCATVFIEQQTQSTAHSIHRLDRETSGVLLLGKNPKAANVCTEYFENNQVQKCYFLIAHKRQENSFPFKACERLGQDDNFIPRLYVHCYDESSSLGKHAQTTFHLIQESEQYVIALAFPKTGRQHQIRAHAAHYGLPLLGDKLYNGDPTAFMRFKDEEATDADHDLMQISRHALHAIALKIPYEGGKTFIAPLPQDLKNWISKNLNVQDLELKVSTLIKDLL